MNSKYLVLLATLTAFAVGCASKTIESRNPAGTGDVDSSTTEAFESYKLPITRGGQKSTRVAYNFWSGEWPQPVIDIHSQQKGTTRIQAFTNLRNPTDADRVNCTIKNGLYHPWSQQDPSLITYYTIANIADFNVVKNTSYQIYNDKTKKLETVQVPKGAKFLNVVYYAENQCGAIYKMGKTSRPFTESCDFFFENKDLVKTTQEPAFSEQWLYFSCEEKDVSGKTLKAFVRDEELLKQEGVTQGCPGEYGFVQNAQACAKD